MLTSGVFNRNDSAQYFVNMPDYGVCSLHGLLLSLRVIDKACCCGNTGLYFDRCKGFENFFFFATVKISLANTTLGTTDYLYFITNFLSDEIENNEMSGSCDN